MPFINDFTWILRVATFQPRADIIKAATAPSVTFSTPIVGFFFAHFLSLYLATAYRARLLLDFILGTVFLRHVFSPMALKRAEIISFELSSLPYLSPSQHPWRPFEYL